MQQNYQIVDESFTAQQQGEVIIEESEQQPPHKKIKREFEKQPTSEDEEYSDDEEDDEYSDEEDDEEYSDDDNDDDFDDALPEILLDRHIRATSTLLTNDDSNTTDPMGNVKEHPLANYVTTREVPFADHPSPISTVQWKSNEHKKEVEKMERKLRSWLYDKNSPGNTGEAAVDRRPLGECSEEAFDMYFLASMDSTLYTRKVIDSTHTDRYAEEVTIAHIVYEFNYPNMPSFGDISWAKNYVVIDQSDVVEALKKLGATIENEYAMANKLFRCIAKKLIVSYDTQTELYYAGMEHWVQSLSGDVITWIESF